MSDSERQTHGKIIDRCYKRRMSRRPADVVVRIRVADPAWVDAILVHMKAAGYDPRPRQTDKPKRRPSTRRVSLSVPEFWVIMANELAAAQGITPQAFMAAVLCEGLFEALLEMEAQRNALIRAERQAASEPHQLDTYPDDIGYEIPF